MFDPAAVNTLIQYRRSVFPKEYTGEKVDDAIVRQILENANTAPTHKLTEPWRFMVFTGKGIGKLAEFQAACYQSVTTAKGIYDESKYKGLLEKPHLSSHIISVAMKRDARKSVPELEEIGAVFCAVQNMYLTATAYGIGAYFSTGGITFFEEAKPFFNLEPEDKLLGFFHIGHTSMPPRKSVRKPVDSKVVWVAE